jgi:hypothetical protein
LLFWLHFIVVQQLPKDSQDNLKFEEFSVDYKERMTRARQETLNLIRARYDEKAPTAAAMDDADDSSQDSFNAQSKIVHDPKSLIKEEMQSWEWFLKALSQCPALNLGFHCEFLHENWDKWCCCPLSERKMQPWREKWNISNCGLCGSSSRVSPGALLDHLREMVKKDSTGRHWVVLEYLEHLYEDYRVTGKKHEAFYPPGSVDHIKVSAARSREMHR